MKNFISTLPENYKFLFVYKRGSHAYGTNIETSDEDYGGVYIQPLNDILGFGYKEQINDNKNDTVFYEVKRFLELISSNNPNTLEALSVPEDCIIYKDPVFDEILKHKSDFVTKVCAKSFAGYAIQQIRKAQGQDKKQNWEKDRMTRKTPLDFCYFHFVSSSIPLTDYLKQKAMDQRFCGLSKVPHSRDTYALYYDFGAEETDDSIHYPKLGFRGIAFEDSNDIRLSSIPKEAPFCGFVSYNKDGYTMHCNDYKSYQEWVKNRNDARWVDVKSHGQKIDGKNILHLVRLLRMSKEIALGKGLIIRRPDADELIKIRMGEVDLQTIIDQSQNDIKEIDLLYENCNLPDEVDKNLVNNLLLKIRKEIYFNK
jgi:uncharacterized protein